MYAHNIVKHSIKLPMSLKCWKFRIPAKGFRFDNSTSTAIRKENVSSTWPIIDSHGYIVEYQSGSIDMIQSMNAQQIVKTKITRPGAAHRFIRYAMAPSRSPVRSCSLDKPKSLKP